MTRSSRLIFHGLNILAESQIQQRHAVVVEEGLIHAVIPQVDMKHFLPATLIEFPEHYILSPGFIDLHIHGAKGSDVMDASPAALAKINQALVAAGVTAY